MGCAIDYKTAGERIRSKRISLGLTQEYICNELNLSTGFYSYIESGKRKAGINTFYMIANLLDLSLDYILCGKINIPKVEDVQISEILILSQELDCGQKQVVIDLIKSLNERLK